MNLERIKKIIANDKKRVEIILAEKKYYKVENDILDTGVKPKDEGKDPLRSADNRIAHNFHQLLVDEKASYMFTYPVIFDIENDKKINSEVDKVLGDDFTRKSKNLCIEASNVGRAWLHYWIKEAEKKEFKYELVNTEEIFPIYDNGLERALNAVIRYYSVLEPIEDEIDDQVFFYIEYWTKETMERWKFKDSYTGEEVVEERESIKHTLGDVPFIEFANNSLKISDLSKYKALIDLFDKVISGFANDLEDIQQIIYILENYGGENLGEFLSDLKRYKAIKTESDGAGGGVKTLQIEIPVEARKVILEILKKQIYESGQGLQQDVESVGNASGVALKFFYRKLELKSGLLETEFKSSYNKLIRAILRFLLTDEDKKINQTWTRNMISNDLETAQIAQISKGVIPDEIIWRNHPWVDNPSEVENMLEKQKKRMIDDYSDLGNDLDE
ncbi:phage portal protein [Paraclostridium ghonii]|uniref:phage portal protein n=1 Tax=Paraclostridium ghonii TaxID=29358 RepID=UPI00202CF093|nr:phage portal protein [Paeniclostridium ghonii]MCM0166989.1 phage portal protein [Paeniclostridium ghonii]